MAIAGTRTLVGAALLATAGLAAAKLGAVMISGSSVLLSSTVHSLIDGSCLVLLFHGLQVTGAGAATASERQPYFWTFVAPILLYALGAGVALYEGVERLLRPQPSVVAGYDYAVLSLGTLLAAAAAWAGLQRLQAARVAGLELLAIMRRPGNAALFTLVLVSAVGVLGQIVALAGLGAADLGENPVADGAASIAIGLVLSALAAAMAVEVKRLLAGAGNAERATTVEAVAIEAPQGWAAAAPALETKSMPPTPTAAVAIKPVAAAAKAAPAAPAAGASSPAQKPQLVARSHGKKGRGKRRR